MKKQFIIDVKDKIACLQNKNEKLVCGNNDYEIVFNFDEDWENHNVKTALFVFADKTVPKVFNGNVCEGISIEKSQVCYVGVFSGDLITTTYAQIDCLASIRDIGGVPRQPTKDEYNQIIDLINNLLIEANLPYDKIPEMNGIGDSGKSNNYARGDHRHPTDTSRASSADLEKANTKIADNAKRISQISTDKQDRLAFDGSYNSETNKVATVETVARKVAELVASAPADFDTLKEIADWLMEHGKDAAEMNSAIKANSEKISTVEQEQNRQKEIISKAASDSQNALTKADIAIDSALGTLEIANTALENSQYAVEKSDYAKQKVDELAESKQDNLVFNGDYNPESNKVATEYTVAEKVAELIANAPEDFNTLKEIADYIASDKVGAAEINNKLSQHTSQIAENKAAIEETNEALYEFKKEYTEETQRLEYEVNTAKDNLDMFKIEIGEELEAQQSSIDYLLGNGKPTEGLEYILSDDGTYYICDGAEIFGDIVIPSHYNGLPVKEISDSAFFGDRRANRMITSVVIPDTIEKIDSNAFAQQWDLSSIILKGTPTTINSGAFSTASAADYHGEEAVPCDIYVPWSEGEVANAPWGADPDRIHYNAIESKDLVNVVNVLKEKVDTNTDTNNIQQDSIDYITEFVLDKPEPTEGLSYELSSDGSYAICNGLGTSTSQDIVIASEYEGKPVRKIDDNAFYGKSIKSIILPYGLTEIGKKAFEYTNIKSVVIPDSVTVIRDRAFARCSKLDEVVISKRIYEVGSQAFVLSHPDKVIFKGTPKRYGLFSDCFGDYTKEIFVPWSEGAVNNAPWGATNAIIHYDYTISFALESRVSALENQIGDIDTALDELHAYAQSLVSGGTTE